MRMKRSLARGVVFMSMLSLVLLCSFSTQVKAQTVPQLVQSLMTDIQNSSLPNGMKNSLCKKLSNGADGVLDLYLAGDMAGAVEKLNDFINQVEAQSGKHIPVDFADDLISQANNIIFNIQNPPRDWYEVGGSASGGGISNTSKDSVLGSVAVDSQGVPYVAWREHLQTIWVKKYDSNLNCWIGPGQPPSALNCGIADDVSMTPEVISHPYGIFIDDSDIPYVFWLEDAPGGDKIYTKKFDFATSSWVEVSAGSASGDGVAAATMTALGIAFDQNDNIYLSYTNFSGEVCVQKFDGSSWGPLPSTETDPCQGIGVAGGNTYLSVDSQGNPYVSWAYPGEFPFEIVPEAIYMKKFSPSADEWVEVGLGSASGDGILGRTLTGTGWSTINRYTDEIYALFIEADIDTLDLYSAHNYNPVTGLFGQEYLVHDYTIPAFIFGGWGDFDVNQNPWFIWGHIYGQCGGHAYIKQFDGSSWVEVPAGSASGLGISGSEGGLVPYMDIYNNFAQGYSIPYAVWMTDVGCVPNGINQIYLKRYWTN